MWDYLNFYYTPESLRAESLTTTRATLHRMSSQTEPYQGKNTTDFTEYIAHVERNDDLAQVEEKALVRKIDLFLLPTIWLMYLLSYVDRTKSAPCHTLSDQRH